MAPKPTPNGNAAQPPAEATPSNIPAVVGINFGNAYASIAVYTKVRRLASTPNSSIIFAFM